MKLQPATKKRLESLKTHPRASLNDVVETLLDFWEESSVAVRVEFREKRRKESVMK